MDQAEVKQYHNSISSNCVSIFFRGVFETLVYTNGATHVVGMCSMGLIRINPQLCSILLLIVLFRFGSVGATICRRSHKRSDVAVCFTAGILER